MFTMCSYSGLTALTQYFELICCCDHWSRDIVARERSSVLMIQPRLLGKNGCRWVKLVAAPKLLLWSDCFGWQHFFMFVCKYFYSEKHFSVSLQLRDWLESVCRQICYFPPNYIHKSNHEEIFAREYSRSPLCRWLQITLKACGTLFTRSCTASWLLHILNGRPVNVMWFVAAHVTLQTA